MGCLRGRRCVVHSIEVNDALGHVAAADDSGDPTGSPARLRFPGVETPRSGEAGDWAESGEILPRRFGAFTLVDVLGEGSWGRVYLARQESPSREVAVKVLRPEATSKEAVRRFAVEAEALGRLSHAGIARI